MVLYSKLNTKKTNLTRVALKYIISLAIILTCLHFSFGTVFAQNQIYKWVDENGVQHFSSMPPPDGEFTSDQIRQSNNTLLNGPKPDPFASVKPQEPPASTETQTITSPGSTVTTIDPEIIAENCERARNNIFLVSSRRRIIVNEENGEQRRLNDDERNNLTGESQTYLDENC